VAERASRLGKWALRFVGENVLWTFGLPLGTLLGGLLLGLTGTALKFLGVGPAILVFAGVGLVSYGIIGGIVSRRRKKTHGDPRKSKALPVPPVPSMPTDVTIRGGNLGRCGGDAIQLDAGDNIVISGVTMSGAGRHGVHVGRGVTSRIEDSHISDVGMDAIHIEGDEPAA
jgi:hypothetical protein